MKVPNIKKSKKESRIAPGYISKLRELHSLKLKEFVTGNSKGDPLLSALDQMKNAPLPFTTQKDPDTHMFRLRPVYEHDPREPLLSDILELKREEMEKQINCKYRDFQDFRYISADLQKDLADLKVNGVNNLQQKLEYGEDLPIKSELEIGRRSQSQPNIFSNNSFFPDTLKPIINKAESPTKEKKVLILDANIRENFTRENTCEFSIASDQPQFKTPRSPLQIDPRPFSTGKLETEKHPETHGKPRNPRNPQKTQKSEENPKPKPKYTGRPYIPRSKNIKNIGLGSRKYMNKRVVVPTKNPRRYTINRSSASPKTPKTQKPGVADAHKNIIIDTIEENNIYEKGKELEVELEVNNGNNSPGAGKTNNNNNTTRKYQHEIPAPVSILNPKPRREIIVEKIEDNSWRSRDIYGARGRYIGLMGLGRSDSDIGVGVGIGGDAEKRVILSKTGSGSCVKRNIGGRTRTSPKHSRYRKSQTEYIPGDIYTPTINEGAQNSNNNPNPNPKLIRMNSMEREGKVLSLTGSQYSFPSAEDLALKSQPGRTTTPKFSLRVSYGERGGGSTGGYTGGVGGTPTPILSGPKYTTGDIIPEGIIDINYTNIYTPQTVLPRVPKNTLLSSMPIAISQNIQNINNIQNIKARAQTTRHIGGKQILENYRVQPIKRPAPPPKSLHYNLLKRSLKYRRKGAGDINKHNHNIYNKNPPPSRQAFTGTGSTSWRCRSSGAPRNIYMDDIRNSLPLTHISTRNSPLGSERISGGFDPSTLEHIDLADYPQELCTSPGAENHIIELREKLMGNTINTINTINNNNNNNIEGRAHRAHNSVITHNSGGAHNSGRAHTSINSMREHTSNPHMSHHASTPSLYSSNEMPPMYEDFLQYISSLNNTLVAKEDPVSKLVQKIRINPDGTDPVVEEILKGSRLRYMKHIGNWNKIFRSSYYSENFSKNIKVEMTKGLPSRTFLSELWTDSLKSPNPDKNKINFILLKDRTKLPESQLYLENIQNNIYKNIHKERKISKEEAEYIPRVVRVSESLPSSPMHIITQNRVRTEEEELNDASIIKPIVPNVIKDKTPGFQFNFDCFK